MRLEIIIKHLGYILLFNAVFLIISFLISAFLGEESALPLLYSALICSLFGLSPLIFVEKADDISFNEGLSIVVFGWILTCLTGTLPYIMWGGEFSFINAWFESVSGFTTTGSTVLNNIEQLPKGLLFWRSSTHWIGGVGIILFVLLVLPQSKNARLTLLNTEMSELSKTNFRYKANKIIHVLVAVYVGLTLAETLLLTISGMSFFDAINHSFATIATGGFSTKNLSVAHFNSVSIEMIITFFMIISGIHFGLIFSTITGKKKNLFNSSIVRAYLLIMGIGIVLVALKLYASGFFGWWESLRHSAFQVVSVGTTTGFATKDTAGWPAFTQIILIYFTIQCAMVGSTSGGMKFDRIYVFFLSVKKQLKLLKHPKAIILIKADGKTISEQLERQTNVFIILYIFVFFCTTIVLTTMDIDIMTAFSASIATIGNVGPGFEGVSSLGNFSNLPVMAKLLLSINMLFGRLEIFNIIGIILIGRN